MKPREILSWKFAFYHLTLPLLRTLGPRWGDALLGGLGRCAAPLFSPRRRALGVALTRARAALRADWSPKAVRPALAANSARFLARDYPLDRLPARAVIERFAVTGFEPLEAALRDGKGAILLGSHLGGHIAGLHWLYRREVPLRLLVQRPCHISTELDRRFRADGPHPQEGFFLRRGLPPGQAVERLLRARAALRDGLAVYMTGDIPWCGSNARPGRLLGQAQTFLSVWADLAALTRTPVFLMFCTHEPGGRYRLTIDPPWTLAPGDESGAVARYLARLEAEIAAHPSDAVAHLLWPCYGPPAPLPAVARRPSRRVAAVARVGY